MDKEVTIDIDTWEDWKKQKTLSLKYSSFAGEICFAIDIFVINE